MHQKIVSVGQLFINQLEASLVDEVSFFKFVDARYSKIKPSLATKQKWIGKPYWGRESGEGTILTPENGILSQVVAEYAIELQKVVQDNAPSDQITPILTNFKQLFSRILKYIGKSSSESTSKFGLTRYGFMSASDNPNVEVLYELEFAFQLCLHTRQKYTTVAQYLLRAILEILKEKKTEATEQMYLVAKSLVAATVSSYEMSINIDKKSDTLLSEYTKKHHNCTIRERLQKKISKTHPKEASRYDKSYHPIFKNTLGKNVILRYTISQKDLIPKQIRS